MRRVQLLSIVVLGALALAVAGCGGDATLARPERDATLLLDAKPDAVHAGIALADARDFDGAEGVHLTVRAPSPSTNAVKLLASDRVTFAVLDIHDLALARARGRDVVGVMALVQRPLSAVLAKRRGHRARVLRRRDRQAPVHPELVLCVSRRTLERDLPVVRAAVRALRRGYDEALADPESALSALATLGAADRTKLARRFDAVAPAFIADAPRFGDLDRQALRRWAQWETREGLTKRPTDVGRAFAFGY
jgi:ABC-type nitrate/sulfonate/bicarbonate transport system substrate-binding protein